MTPGESHSGVIRSYQRIFRPERRIYQIEGRQIPIPGGVPLRWLAWAGATWLAVLVLSARSTGVALAAGLSGAFAGLVIGGSRPAVICGAMGLAAAPAAAVVLGALDWPLRLVLLPALVATLGTQATPDGRRADRFALSWLATRLSPPRQSLRRPLPNAGRPHAVDGQLWVAAAGTPDLRRGRVRGPADVAFAVAVRLDRRRLRRDRLVAHTAAAHSAAHLSEVRVRLGAGEVLEVRP